MAFIFFISAYLSMSCVSTTNQVDLYLEKQRLCADEQLNTCVDELAGNLLIESTGLTYDCMTIQDTEFLIDQPKVVEKVTNEKAFVCSVNIEEVFVSNCYYYSGASYTTVSVTVSWIDVSTSIDVTVNGQTRTIIPGINTVANTGGPSTDHNIISPQVVAFELPADGNSYAITATVNPSCNDSDMVTLPSDCIPISCSGNDLGGTIFEDYDANGIQATNEVNGIPGVTIEGTTSSGMTLSTVSDLNGDYVFNLTPADYPVRLEFKNIPSIFGEGTQNGSDGRTTVQFYSSADCSADLGVLNPSLFCDSAPQIVVPCYITGALTNPSVMNLDALVAINYTASGLKNVSQMTTLATASEVGSTWGVAYNKFTNKLFSAAVLKRHVSLTDDNLSGLFVTDMLTASTTDFINVSTNLGIDVGSVGTNAARGITGGTASPSRDADGFFNSGKLGIGDIELSDDGNTLYLTNLKDQKIYAVDITAYNTSLTLPTSADVDTITITQTCNGGSFRPWALKFYKGKLYVGAVCDASVSLDKADLEAFVYELDPDMDHASTVIMEVPLTYPKGYSLATYPDDTGWFPWSDVWNGPNGKFIGTDFGNSILRPEPILADIEFDIDGSIILAFNDRTGMQSGYQNYGPNASDGTTLFVGFVAGDILRGYNSNGVFIIENNAKAGPDVGYGPGNNQGPGFGEFYNDNSFFFTSLAHAENIMGGIALRPGSGQVVAAVLDPIDVPVGTNGTVGNNNYFWAGGLRHWSNSTGLTENSYQVYATLSGTSPGSLAKASGLGDLELACASPEYIEIGNYVWLDENANSIQDPDELGIDGVTIELVKGGSVIATTETANGGEYYFSSNTASDPNLNWTGTGADTQINPGMTYTIRISNAEGGSQQTPLLGLSITDPDPSSNAFDMIDSDAIENSSSAEVQVMISSSSNVDHKVDFGFKPCDVILQVNQISSCVAGQFSATIEVSWENAPTTGDLQYSIDGGTYLSANRTNFSDEAMGHIVNLTGLSCGSVKEVIVRFEHATDCFEQMIFVFPPADPGGYIYCKESGQVIPGGTISVLPPAGGSVLITDDGSTGRYYWLVTGSPAVAGIYTMSFSPPAGYTNSGTPGVLVGDTDDIMDPTFGSEDNPSSDDPLLLGSDTLPGGMFLADFTTQGNPFFLDFDIEFADPFVDLNNLPLEGCPSDLDNACWGDFATECVPDALLYPGVAAVTCGVVQAVPQAERYVVAYMVMNEGLTSTGRDTITNPDSVLHHVDWRVDSIGNVFGVAINQSTAEVFVTASSNYGAGFGFFNNSPAIINYGVKGNPAHDTIASGTVYKLDAVTGAASVFAVLPQRSTTVEHWDCEFNAQEISRDSTGVGLGNIVYDEVNDQFFVSNTEDGRIYRLSSSGTILDSYDPLNYDSGTPGIDDLEDIPYGLAVEPGSKRLFFGVIDDPGPGPFGSEALPGAPSVYSIDLNADGSFAGSVLNTTLPAGATYDNYVGTEELHISIPTGVAGGAFSYTTHTVYFISDLAFSPDGSLLVGIRVGCHGSWHSSYNHWAETNSVQLNPVNNRYESMLFEYDLSVTGDAGNDDSYGGVATYTLNNATCDIFYAASSADVIDEPGPHGIVLYQSTTTNSPITPIGVFEYGVLPTDDPKGIGGDVEIFNKCNYTCNITGPTSVCVGDTVKLDYIPDCPNLLFTWDITSGDATIMGPDDSTTVMIVPGTTDFVATLIPSGTSARCDHNVMVHPLPVVGLNDPGNVCLNDMDITFTGTPTDANGSFTSTATSGFTDNNNGTAILDLSDAGVGTYDITYTYLDGNGCSADTTVSVEILSLPTLVLNDPADVCVDGNDLNFNALPVGGSWSTTAPGASFDSSGAAGTASIDVSIAGPGTYDVEYSFTDVNGCTESITVSVTVFDLPVANAGMDTTVCAFDPVQLDAGMSSGTATLSFSWSPSTGLSATNIPNPIATLTDTMEYFVTVTDGNGCQSIDSVSVNVIENVAVGNVVFHDLNDDGDYDAGIDSGIVDVVLQLYPVDSIIGVHQPLASTVSGANGFYEFDQMKPGQYIIHIPSSEFTDGETLYYLENISPEGIDDTNDDNVDENGQNTLDNGGISSTIIDLQPNDEPESESGQGSYSGTLDDDNVNFTVDFGFRTQRVAIGNLVWMDNDYNGIYESGTDMVLDGVIVELYANGDTPGVDTPLATDTTDSNGAYLFDQLLEGEYIVHIPASEFGPGEPLEDKESSPGNGGDTATDDDADENGVDGDQTTDGISSGVIDLYPNEEPDNEAGAGAYPGTLDDDNVNMTVDFSFEYEKVAIGNIVYMDNNYDGDFDDPGDMAIDEVIVELYASGDTAGVSTPVATDTTSGGGHYLFDQLTEGEYFVHIPASEFGNGEPLEDKESTPGNGGDDMIDDDGDENGIDSDQMNDGISSDIIDLFPNDEPSGESGDTNYGGSLDDDNVNETVDFGFSIERVAIGNLVWMDNDYNGIYESGSDMVLDGVIVELYANGDTPGVDTPLATDTTDSNGAYLFDQLLEGEYIVHIPASEFGPGEPLEDKESSPGNGGDIATDDNADENGVDGDQTTDGISSGVIDLYPNEEPDNEAGAGTYPGTLDDDNVNMTVDFSFEYEKVAIGNIVYMDNNYDGDFDDPGDMAIDDVIIELYASGDTAGVSTPVATDTTSGGGHYLFDQLTEGEYFVHIPASEFGNGEPLEDKESTPGNGGDDMIDDDGDENGIDGDQMNDGISSDIIDLFPNDEPSGESGDTNYGGSLDDDNVNETVDFGFSIERVAIGNLVWMDNDYNGIYESGSDMVLDGVIVELYANGDTPGVDTPLATDTTDSNGAYLFDQLLEGEYIVHIPASEFGPGEPLEDKESSPGNGGDIATDDNADENGVDGDQTTDGISSGVIDLYPNEEPDNEAGVGTYPGTLDDDNVNMTVDFSFEYEKVAIGNIVYMDNNYDGDFDDPGDMAIDDVIVELYASGDTAGVSMPVATDTTSGGGHYLFDQLTEGEYFVHIPASEFGNGEPLEDKESTPGNGGDDMIDDDGDENGIDGDQMNDGISSDIIDLFPNDEPSGESGDTNYGGSLDDDNVNETVDFGFSIERVAIGNLVWMDNDYNGVFDDSIDMVLADVLVELYEDGDTAGVTTPLATDTTDIDGHYLFDQLLEGEYFVHIPASEFGNGEPLEDKQSSVGNGTDDTNDDDSDENGCGCRSYC